MAGESDFTIRVKVDPTQAKEGLTQVKSELGGVQDLLVSIGEAVGLYELGHQALDLVESFEQVQNRLRTLTHGEQDLKDTTAALFQVTEQTRSSFTSTADVYARLARANQNVGFTQEQLLQVTKALNQESIIQGRTGEDLTGIVGQLSIALQTGTLNARALRLIFRDYPDLASALEVQLGRTSAEFKKLGQEGKISGEDILNALLGASTTIEDKFGKTTVTVSQSMKLLKTNFTEFLSAENESLGVTNALSEALKFAADHVEALTYALVGLSGVMVAQLVGKAIPLVIAGFGAMAKSYVAFTEAVVYGSTAATLGVTAVAAAAVGYAFHTITTELKEAQEIRLDAIAHNALTAFGKLGEVVEESRAHVRQLNAELERDPSNPLILAQLDAEGTKIVAIQEAQKKLSDEAHKKQIAEEAQYASAAKDLQDQINLLGLDTKSREVQAKLIETVNKLQQQGITTTDAQKIALQDKLETIQALGDQDKVLKQLNGTQEEYARKVEAASILLHNHNDELHITAAQYKAIVESGGLPGYISGLEREAQMLKLTADQQSIVNALKEAATIKGKPLSAAEALQVTQLVQSKAALTEQAKVLQEINGPQEQYAKRVEALVTLLDKGKISLFEYNQALSGQEQGPKLPGGFRPEEPVYEGTAKPTTGPLAETLSKMKEETELLALTNEQRTIAIALMQAQNSVGRQLTSDEVKQITQLTEAHQSLTENLQAEERARASVAALHAQVLNEINGPQAALAGSLTQTNIAFQKGEISADGYARALTRIDLAARQTDTSLNGGLARGFDRIKLQVGDVGSTVEHSLVHAFDSANQAMTDFLRTGKLNFDQFASDILADVAKIALQMAESSLLGGGGSGGGGLLASLFGGGGGNFGLSSSQISGGFFYAEGGDYPANQPFIAGEKGPEIVDPGGQGGRVIPHEQTRSMLGQRQAPVHVAPPQVHVHITNVDDPAKAGTYLRSREGEKEVMNILARNREAVRRNIQ